MLRTRESCRESSPRSMIQGTDCTVARHRGSCSARLAATEYLGSIVQCLEYHTCSIFSDYKVIDDTLATIETSTS